MAKKVKFDQSSNPWANINLKTAGKKKAGKGKKKGRGNRGKGGAFGS